jgi:pimeloyl-ACP methyl ester carboxylesterase
MEGYIEKKIANNDGVEIEYYVSNQVNSKPTLIISMGIWEPAFRAFPLIERLIGTHCIVLSYRGRGGSSSPKTGYDWKDHALDLACVLQTEPINTPIFLGFSKGVSYMLGYLSMHPYLAKGIIIIDYPGIHLKPNEGFAKTWWNMRYNGLKLGDYITEEALVGIERESSQKEFYNIFKEVICPVWVFRGRSSESSIPSNLTEEDIERYVRSVKILEVVDFHDSGHMILDDELSKSSTIIRNIIDNLPQ